MTLVVIGPVTKDLVLIGSKKYYNVGGATYFQSFVFDKFYKDYLSIVNCSDENLINNFPTKDNVKLILKDNTHYFINKYPFKDNLDIREQSSNFADIPILKKDLKNILPEKIDAFVLNPLNRYDFPFKTIDYLKNFNVPIFVSIQGFLRIPGVKSKSNYTIKLDEFDKLNKILSGVFAVFLDEFEASIINYNLDVNEIVITNGSKGSRIISTSEIKINPVKCEKVVDTTGCGDTYMAAYISQRLQNASIKQSGNFASKIASMKISNFGSFKMI